MAEGKLSMRALDDYDYKLLESVLVKEKYLDMGRTPVSAIQKCWELCDMQLLEMRVGNWVHLTDKGRQIIKERNKF